METDLALNPVDVVVVCPRQDVVFTPSGMVDVRKTKANGAQLWLISGQHRCMVQRARGKIAVDTHDNNLALALVYMNCRLLWVPTLKDPSICYRVNFIQFQEMSQLTHVTAEAHRHVGQQGLANQDQHA